MPAMGSPAVGGRVAGIRRGEAVATRAAGAVRRVVAMWVVVTALVAGPVAGAGAAGADVGGSGSPVVHAVPVAGVGDPVVAVLVVLGVVATVLVAAGLRCQLRRHPVGTRRRLHT